MATTAITLNIDNADLPTLVPELCNWAGLAVSNANAKQAIAIFLKKVHAEAQRKAAQAAAQATIDQAETIASNIVIT